MEATRGKLDPCVEDDWAIIEEQIANYLVENSDPSVASDYKAIKQFRYVLLNGSKFSTEELQRILTLASIEELLDKKIKTVLDSIGDNLTLASIEELLGKKSKQY